MLKLTKDFNNSKEWIKKKIFKEYFILCIWNTKAAEAIYEYCIPFIHFEKKPQLSKDSDKQRILAKFLWYGYV